MMSYPEQLETQEWSSKRLSILERDNYTCQFCHRKQTECITFGDKNLYVGVDTSHHLTLKDIVLEFMITQESLEQMINYIDLENIKSKARVFDNHIIIGITQDGTIYYALENNLDIFRKNIKQKVYKVVRAKTINYSYVYIYYQNDVDLQQDIELPLFFCSEDMIKLNVHHKHYIVDKKAWEYKDTELITLCDSCHYNIHQCSDVQIYTYRNGLQIAMNYTPCTRCGGVGYFPEYKNIENGICFRCRGNRFEELVNE